jgi:L-asparaginase II
MTTHNLVINWRGGMIENSHIVHAAVVDSAKTLLYTLGDPSRLTLTRSSAKPFQALAILETGAAEKFQFDDTDVALICASHNSEEQHVSRVTAMLQKAAVTKKDMNCGGHPALSNLGAKGGLGIAVKIEDGNIGILYIVLMEMLTRLEIGTEEIREYPKTSHCSLPKNTMGVATGHTSFSRWT